MKTMSTLADEINARAAAQGITLTQVSIALAKLHSGTRPGDDMWCDFDHQALEMAVGHEVARPTPAWESGDPATEAWTRNDDRTFTLLMLCGGHDVPREAVTGWTDQQCEQAEDWASREHLNASDNDDVERVPMPPHVTAHPPKPRAGGLWD